MAKNQPPKKGKGGKVVFRRIRGRLVPIRVEGAAQIGAGYGVAAAAGAAGAVMLKPNRFVDKATQKYLSGGRGIDSSVLYRKSGKPLPGAFKGYSMQARIDKAKFRQPRNLIDKALDAFDKKSGLMKVQKGVSRPDAVLMTRLGDSAKKWARRGGRPAMVAGTLAGSALAVTGFRKLIGDRNSETITGQLAETVVGAGVFSAATYGFLRSSGRSPKRSAVVAGNVITRAVRRKPVWNMATGLLPRAVRVASRL
jgi:hypothetical protein